MVYDSVRTADLKKTFLRMTQIIGLKACRKLQKFLMIQTEL